MAQNHITSTNMGHPQHGSTARYDTPVANGTEAPPTQAPAIAPLDTYDVEHKRGHVGLPKHTVEPPVMIFLRPIAPPAALGLAGFAGSTWIASSWIANWWGNPDSPTIFFPFVMTFGGLAQFIAGLFGFAARDTLVTVINTMWGSFWIAIGILYGFVATGDLAPHSIHSHFPELASWFVILTFFTWSGALAACARDAVLAALLFSLAIGSTIACALFNYNDPSGASISIKVAAYFFMLSALLAWWRATVYMIEEAFGPHSQITKLFPIFRTKRERNAAPVIPGYGEPGVKRGVPKLLPEPKDGLTQPTQ